MKKHYISLWLLLATAFMVFAVTSAFEMPEIAGHQFKSSEIYDHLFATPSPEAESIPDDTIITIPDTIIADISPQIFPAPCDTASQVIMLFGDSMLEGLAPRLAAYAQHNGHTLYSVMWYSSTSEVWGKSDKIKSYINRLRPTYIILCLGANELNVKDIEKKREKYVKKILEDIGDIPFIWVGPPNWKKDTGINKLISAHAPNGTFFLSDGINFERASDGAHPTRSSAALWMDSVIRWMPANALHPIKMDIPSVSTAKPKRIFVHQPNEQ